MSCYINGIEVFAVIRNTIMDLMRYRNSENHHLSSNFFIAINELFQGKDAEDELDKQILKCYIAQIRSYNNRYGEKEKAEKNFLELLKSSKMSYYHNKHHKVMLFKSIKCMMYQIEGKFSSKFWDSITDSLMKDIIYKSEEFEKAAWGYGEPKDLK